MAAISGSEDNTAVIVGALLRCFALVLATCSLIWSRLYRKRAKTKIVNNIDQ